MVDIDGDPICQEALALATGTTNATDNNGADGDGAVERLVALAGSNRAALVDARNAFAERLHARRDDHQATAALRLLNRAVAAYGWHDPYDWRSRLGNRLAKP